jgi:anti-anti-sigma regulatory factor
MLRISYADTSEGQKWILSGRLSGAWVEELRSFWLQARERDPQARAVVDLREVTFIDESGVNLLAEMHGHGTEFLVAGVENKHVLDTLGTTDSACLGTQKRPTKQMQCRSHFDGLTEGR